VKVEEKEKKGTKKNKEIEEERDRETEREKRDQLALTTRPSTSEELLLRFIFARIYIFISETAISETPSPLLLRPW
jgi:hypothetical protein